LHYRIAMYNILEYVHIKLHNTFKILTKLLFASEFSWQETRTVTTIFLKKNRKQVTNRGDATLGVQVPMHQDKLVFFPLTKLIFNT